MPICWKITIKTARDPNDEVFGHCFVWFFSAKIEDKEVPGLYIYTLPPTRSTKFVPEK